MITGSNGLFRSRKHCTKKDCKMKPIRILLVEDEAIIALHLQMQLRKIGYHIEIASTGEQALQKLASFKPNLMILDKGLPGKLDGLEVARRVHTQYHIPFIMITGYQDQEILNEIQKLNPLAYLIKPIQVEKLKQIIQTHFIQ